MSSSVKCPFCDNSINPAALLAATGKGKPKTMTDAAISARKLNASKPRPNAKGKKKPRKTPVSIVKEHLETVTSF